MQTNVKVKTKYRGQMFWRAHAQIVAPCGIVMILLKKKQLHNAYIC